jgi:hypothetical protein
MGTFGNENCNLKLRVVIWEAFHAESRYPWWSVCSREPKEETPRHGAEQDYRRLSKGQPQSDMLRIAIASNFDLIFFPDRTLCISIWSASDNVLDSSC